MDVGQHTLISIRLCDQIIVARQGLTLTQHWILMRGVMINLPLGYTNPMTKKRLIRLILNFIYKDQEKITLDFVFMLMMTLRTLPESAENHR